MPTLEQMRQAVQADYLLRHPNEYYGPLQYIHLQLPDNTLPLEYLPITPKDGNEKFLVVMPPVDGWILARKRLTHQEWMELKRDRMRKEVATDE